MQDILVSVLLLSFAFITLIYFKNKFNHTLVYNFRYSQIWDSGVLFWKQQTVSRFILVDSIWITYYYITLYCLLCSYFGTVVHRLRKTNSLVEYVKWGELKCWSRRSAYDTTKLKSVRTVLEMLEIAADPKKDVWGHELMSTKLWHIDSLCIWCFPQ